MRNYLKLIMRKQPIEYPSDSVSAAVSKAITTHRAAVREFEGAIQDLLNSHDKLAATVRSMQGGKSSNGGN